MPLDTSLSKYSGLRKPWNPKEELEDMVGERDTWATLLTMLLVVPQPDKLWRMNGWCKKSEWPLRDQYLQEPPKRRDPHLTIPSLTNY